MNRQPQRLEARTLQVHQRAPSSRFGDPLQNDNWILFPIFFYHRVDIPATTDVIAVFCEDTGVGNDDKSYAVVVLTTGEVTGLGYWSCVSTFEVL